LLAVVAVDQRPAITQQQAAVVQVDFDLLLPQQAAVDHLNLL
jgi:hypothetical protein